VEAGGYVLIWKPVTGFMQAKHGMTLQFRAVTLNWASFVKAMKKYPLYSALRSLHTSLPVG
jgi:hypothetical protein